MGQIKRVARRTRFQLRFVTKSPTSSSTAVPSSVLEQCDPFQQCYSSAVLKQCTKSTSSSATAVLEQCSPF